MSDISEKKEMLTVTFPTETSSLETYEVWMLGIVSQSESVCLWHTAQITPILKSGSKHVYRYQQFLIVCENGIHGNVSFIMQVTCIFCNGLIPVKITLVG